MQLKQNTKDNNNSIQTNIISTNSLLYPLRMFYFIHQIKLETIPFVQKEIQSFISYFQQHLDRVYMHDQQLVSEQSRKTTEKLFNVMVKKQRQIQMFYYHNWMDYRASLILRAKRLITDFYSNHQKFFDDQFKDKSIQQSHVFSQQKYHTPEGNLSQQNSQRFIVSEFVTNSLQKVVPHQQNLNSKFKQSVKRIKMQFAENPIKSAVKTPKISLKSNKKVQKTVPNISKEQIHQEVNKIIEKQKIKQQAQNNSLILNSKKKQQQKNEKKNMQNIIHKSKNQQKDKKIIEKYISNTSNSKSVQKTKSKRKQMATNKLKQKVNVSRKQEVKLTNSIQKVKQPQITAITAKFRNKKMTKQEYVQYLVNKNKKQSKKNY